MPEPESAASDALDYDAATAVVRDLFGRACLFPKVGITLDLVPCLACEPCTRDWSPEARMIVDAAHDVLRGRIAAALDICARHEWGAIRWEDPLPVPSWIAEVRAALDPAAWDPKAVTQAAASSPVGDDRG